MLSVLVYSHSCHEMQLIRCQEQTKLARFLRWVVMMSSLPRGGKCLVKILRKGGVLFEGHHQHSSQEKLDADLG